VKKPVAPVIIEAGSLGHGKGVEVFLKNGSIEERLST